MSRVGKPIEKESGLVVAWGWGEGLSGYRVSFRGNGDVWNKIEVAVVQHRGYTRCQ